MSNAPFASKKELWYVGRYPSHTPNYAVRAQLLSRIKTIQESGGQRVTIIGKVELT